MVALMGSSAGTDNGVAAGVVIGKGPLGTGPDGRAAFLAASSASNCCLTSSLNVRPVEPTTPDLAVEASGAVGAVDAAGTKTAIGAVTGTFGIMGAATAEKEAAKLVPPSAARSGPGLAVALAAAAVAAAAAAAVPNEAAGDEPAETGESAVTGRCVRGLVMRARRLGCIEG